MSELSLYEKSKILMETMRTKRQITDTKNSKLQALCKKIGENIIGKEHPQYNSDGSPKLDEKGVHIILHDNPKDWNDTTLTDDVFQKKYDLLKAECDDILGV